MHDGLAVVVHAGGCFLLCSSDSRDEVVGVVVLEIMKEDGYRRAEGIDPQ